MDTAMGFMFSLIFLSAWLFGLAILYKNRASVKKWLNSPYFACDDRELRLKRQIENAEKELADIAKQKTETED